MTFETIIQPMTENDLPLVLALECWCHSSPWSEAMFRSELANPLSRIDLSWRGSQLVGFICSWRVCEELSILNVATAPDARRSGVARALLRHVLDRNLQIGLDRALLEVRLSNLGAIALYESFGFRPVDRRHGYYSDGEDALVMEVLFTGPVNNDRKL